MIYIRMAMLFLGFVFLIASGWEQRNKMRAEAAKAIKGSVGGNDESEMWDNEATCKKKTKIFQMNCVQFRANHLRKDPYFQVNT